MTTQSNPRLISSLKSSSRAASATIVHPEIGERICRPLRSGAEVGPVVRWHHERWDGSGYPDGVAGEAIPLGARIVAVADAFDAMTTDRPYRKALATETAWGILRDGAGTQWDQFVVEAFASFQRDRKEEVEFISGA